MVMKKAVLLLAILLLGCLSGPQLRHYELGSEITLHINETVAVGSDPLLVRLAGIPEDSRCPTGVVCIWAGRVTAALEFRRENGPGPGFLSLLNLTKGQGNDSATFDYGNNTYLVKLVDVEPYPKAGSPINASGYNATIIITKTSG